MRSPTCPQKASAATHGAKAQVLRRLGLALVVGCALAACRPSPNPGADQPAAAAASAPANSAVADLLVRVDGILAAHRKLIVLLSGDKDLSEPARKAANTVGHMIFHEQTRQTEAMVEAVFQLPAGPARYAAVEAMLERIEAAPDWFDADRLAFRPALEQLARRLSESQSLNALKLTRRIQDDLAVLAQVQAAYDRELRDIFDRFTARDIELKREKWADYVAKLQAIYSRDAVMKDYATIVPFGPPAASSAPASGAVAQGKPKDKAGEADAREFFGHALPPKTLVLTFDDGPHPRYTDEVLDILERFGAPAIFFQVGRNLGQVDAKAGPKPGPLQKVSKRLLDSGHVLANHSFSHSLMTKFSEDGVRQEAADTEALLDTTGRTPSTLFRFPYGARNTSSLDTLALLKLRSVMWNIDSKDWADPIPKSIAKRVIDEAQSQQRGIVLFHDIHARTVEALPLILQHFVDQGYKFATWQEGRFVVRSPKEGKGGLAAASTAPSEGAGLYRDSHALIVGIDQYSQWPVLKHAVRDAKAMREMLVQRFGFNPANVTTLYDAQATRSNIMRVLNDALADPKRVQRDDRVYIFFAGHGATRRLPSGRDLGYFIPVDASQKDFAADGIAMPALQDAAEGIAAKHLLFVLDACYSGLGLTRGGAASSTERFLQDNSRRIGRQMMSAGGADQVVADDGPGGHSVFTWTLLQALEGKGDLNADGVITGTELAAYVAPAVASISRQTPAFGNLPGSSGGEFIFTLPREREALSASAPQLESAAIELAKRVEAAQAPAVKAGEKMQVTIRDFDGGQNKLSLPAPAPMPAGQSSRQAAQRANDRGLSLYRERRYDEAEAAFTEALQFDAQFAMAANNLGFVYFKRNKAQEAARWFSKAIELDPSRALAYLNLGDAYLQLNDDANAIAAFQRFVALNPKHHRSPALQAWLAKPQDAALRPNLGRQ